MKNQKLNLICFLILFNCNNIFSQKNIIYDFQTKTLTIPENINEKENVFIKVNNINLYLFKVELAAKNKEFNKDIPKLIQQIIPDSGTDIKEGIPKDLQKLMLDLASEKREGNVKAADFIPLKKAFQNLIDKDRQLYFKTMKIYNHRYSFKSADNISQMDLENFYNGINEFEKEYYKIVSSGLSNDEITILVAIKTLYDNQSFLTKYKKYTIFSYNFSEKNIMFTSAPMIAKPDEMEFSLKISPRSALDTMFFMPTNTDSIRFVVPVKRNTFNLSFSTGLFVSSLYNKSYAYTPTFKSGSKVDVDYYKIEAEETNKSSVGLNDGTFYERF